MATTNIKNPEEHAISIPTHANEQSPFLENEFEAKPTNFPPETSSLTSSPNKPPLYPNSESPLTRRTSMRTSKSRFGQPTIPLNSQTLESYGASSPLNGSSPRSLSRRSNGELPTKEKEKEKEKGKKKMEPDEKEIYRRVTAQLSARNSRRTTVKLVIQLFIFLSLLTCLICSLTVKGFKGSKLGGVIELWKLFTLLLVVFSGLLITGWFVHIIVFLIEWMFLLKKNVVYFTHALQNNVQVFLWILVVLITWVVLFKHDSKTIPDITSKTKHILDFITWTLATLLIGSFVWLIKTTLIKILASSFHMNRFFDRIQEAVFHHYVLQTLAGTPLFELDGKISRQDSMGSVSLENTGTNTEKKKVDWAKLHQMRKDRVPSHTMKLLVDVVSNSGFSSMSSILDENVAEGGVELDDDEITGEEQAIATAYDIFNKMTAGKNEKYIGRSDFRRYLIREEVNLVYPLFEKNDKGQIDLKSFVNWVVSVYKDRQVLKHALDDNKTAVDEFNKLLNCILIIMMIILWLLLTEVVTTKLLLFFSSQLVVAAFIFGSTCKSIFEAIIFVFARHPFDVGDRCIIDGEMMIVEEMNILSTVFLKTNKELVDIPNSVLVNKAIGNYYRSPHMGDTLEFGIDYSTPLPKIAQLKERIKLYIDETKQYWHPEHSLVVKEIENVNKIKLALFVTHTMNFQDVVEKNKRRTELVLKLKEIFDNLEITYHLLPQEIHLTKMA